jgi:antagonist of KipI
MDSFALAATNIIAGNPANAPALEWALTSGTIRFERQCVFATGGASPEVFLGGKPVAPLTAVAADAGDELTVGAFSARRFLYVAISGGVAVPTVLQSAATYLPAKFGGFEGRMIKRGDQLPMGRAKATSAGFKCPRELSLDYDVAAVRVTRGPQAALFGHDSWRTLLGAEFTIAHASDRTGYRLEGQTIPHQLGLLPSEAGCCGAIQVPLDGNPIVLMADAPTVGGYPKIAVVSEADLPVLAQKAPGDRVRFDLITIEESQRSLRRRAADLALLSAKRDSGAASA